MNISLRGWIHIHYGVEYFVTVLNISTALWKFHYGVEFIFITRLNISLRGWIFRYGVEYFNPVMNISTALWIFHYGVEMLSLRGSKWFDYGVEYFITGLKWFGYGVEFVLITGLKVLKQSARHTVLLAF